MATIQRNVKTFGTRSFVGEVAAAPSNYAPILSNEVDADLDTAYAAWNGGADTVNIKDGAVTTPKIADLNVTTAKLADLSVTTPKLAVAATTPIIRNALLPGAVNLTASEIVLLSIASVTTRGGLVLFVVSLTGNVNLSAATDAQSQLRIYVGTTLIASYSYYGFGIAGQSFYVPVNYSFSLPWQSGVGTNTMEVRGIRTLGTQNWQVSAGTFSVIEHA
jgi:hypothetical protein